MAPRKTNLTLERFNPSSTRGASEVLNISLSGINLAIFALALWATYEAFQSNYFTNQNIGSKSLSGINLAVFALALWATYEAFQSNYFTNQNIGSKTFSVVLVVNASLALIALFGLSIFYAREGGLLILLATLYPIAVTFFHIVYLLNVWKVNGVIVEKETNSALTFIKVWSIVMLVGSAFNLTLDYNRKKRIDKL